MDAVKELVNQAGNLSQEDRKRLIEALEESLAQEVNGEELAPGGPYSRTLELAGTFETATRRVAEKKNSN
ncbi:MAG: hypothetical protein V3T83_12385 [Acidobacteriota bacterium]